MATPPYTLLTGDFTVIQGHVMPTIRIQFMGRKGRGPRLRTRARVVQHVATIAPGCYSQSKTHRPVNVEIVRRPVTARTSCAPSPGVLNPDTNGHPQVGGRCALSRLRR